ncbi:MAG: archaeosortase/exosortase family protein [Pseudomonadota bacterium]
MARPPYPLLLLGAAGATWPVWLWYVPASLDASNDYIGLFAAASVLALLWRARGVQPSAAPSHALALPLACMLAYTAATLAGWSIALRAVPAMLALATLASSWRLGRRLDLPLTALALMALPFAATLQFYLGYPLRAFTGTLAAALLQLNGLAVVREGAMLAWNGTLVAIDAPCSGVKMLWAGLYLALALAAVQGLNARRSALALALAAIVLVLANAMRAAALFYVETGLIALPGWAHQGAGLVSFVLAALVLLYAMQAMKGARP